MKKKAIALISGGLDSILAARLVMEQGFHVIGIYFTSAFSKSYGREQDTPAYKLCTAQGIDLRVIDMGIEYIDMIRNPRHGYGKNMNPCIDCKIFMLARARSVMEAEDAAFIATGEVLGQRPMSQRRDTLHVIERCAGLSGIVLRPLSARLLPPTRPEQDGVVDRERLLDVSGRSRAVQLRLAGQFGIKGFSSPAGGCLLTDKNFSTRLRDLFATQKDITTTDIRLLTIGRHFRLESGIKVVLGRNEGENHILASLTGPGYPLFTPIGFPGPAAVCVGRPSHNDKQAVLRLIQKYSKPVPGRKTAVSMSGEVISFEAGENALEAVIPIR